MKESIKGSKDSDEKSNSDASFLAMARDIGLQTCDGRAQKIFDLILRGTSTAFIFLNAKVTTHQFV